MNFMCIYFWSSILYSHASSWSNIDYHALISNDLIRYISDMKTNQIELIFTLFEKLKTTTKQIKHASLVNPRKVCENQPDVRNHAVLSLTVSLHENVRFSLLFPVIWCCEFWAWVCTTICVHPYKDILQRSLTRWFVIRRFLRSIKTFSQT